jgi:hypothetical protein
MHGRVQIPEFLPILETPEPRLLLDAAAREQALELFSVSPALFVQNQGQWADPSVRFVHNGSGANVATLNGRSAWHRTMGIHARGDRNG